MKKTNKDLIELYQGSADSESAPKTGHATPGSRKDAVKKPLNRSASQPRPYLEEEHQADALVADPVVEYMSLSDLKARIAKVQSDMTKAAKAMDFMEAARLRDEMLALKELAEAKSPAENV